MKVHFVSPLSSLNGQIQDLTIHLKSGELASLAHAQLEAERIALEANRRQVLRGLDLFLAQGSPDDTN